MTKFYLFLFGCALLAAGCKSASKAYQKGDYTDAVELGVKKLQKDPYDSETKELVQSAYNFAVTEHEGQIRNLLNSKDENRFDAIFRSYVQLQDLYNTIHAAPTPARLIKATDYTEYVETYRNKAAEVHAERALAWMQEGTKAAFREAYNEYNAALRFTPGNSELRRKRDSAYDAALTKVVFVPMQQYRGYSYTSSYQMDRFQRDIFRTLANSMSNGFVRFYSDFEARSADIIPDQILELSMSRIAMGLPQDQRSSREVSKEVVVKETVYRPDSVVKQYSTVRARITTTNRVLHSEGDLVITLRDGQGRIIWNDRFTGQHRSESIYTSYTGDERALSEADKKSLGGTSLDTPREDVILEALFRQIQNVGSPGTELEFAL